MKSAFYAVWIIVGLTLSHVLGTLIKHIFTYGWFTPVS